MNKNTLLDELRIQETQKLKLEKQKRAIRAKQLLTESVYRSSDGRKVRLNVDLIAQIDKGMENGKHIIHADDIDQFKTVNPETKRYNSPIVAWVQSNSNKNKYYEVKLSENWGLSSNDRGWIYNARGNRTSSVTDAVAEKIKVIGAKNR